MDCTRGPGSKFSINVTCHIYEGGNPLIVTVSDDFWWVRWTRVMVDDEIWCRQGLGPSKADGLGWVTGENFHSRTVLFGVLFLQLLRFRVERVLLWWQYIMKFGKRIYMIL